MSQILNSVGISSDMVWSVNFELWTEDGRWLGRGHAKATMIFIKMPSPTSWRLVLAHGSSELASSKRTRTVKWQRKYQNVLSLWLVLGHSNFFHTDETPILSSSFLGLGNGSGTGAATAWAKKLLAVGDLDFWFSLEIDGCLPRMATVSPSLLEARTRWTRSQMRSTLQVDMWVIINISFVCSPRLSLTKLFFCSRQHHSPCPPIPMITSPPPGRPSTQNFLNLNIPFVSPFLTLRTVSGNHFLTSRLKMFKIVSRSTWLPHSPLLAVPFWLSRTTISSNWMGKEVLWSSLEVYQADKEMWLPVHFLLVNLVHELCRRAWRKNLGRKTFTLHMCVHIDLYYRDVSQHTFFLKPFLVYHRWRFALYRYTHFLKILTWQLCSSHSDGYPTWTQFSRMGEQRKWSTLARKHRLRKFLVFSFFYATL